MIVQSVDNRAVAITGRFFKTAKIRDEPYEPVDQPQDFIDKLKEANIAADLFTFLPEISERTPKHDFPFEWDSFSVLPITTYEAWWTKQINDKTRNMVRKAQKSGVELRRFELNEEFIRGIMQIYNETPVRQGKPFKHYAKEFEAVKEELATFLDRSDFIGAFYKNELIGFIKLVNGQNVSSLMQVISKIACRDKAPTNGLIAKAVEVCAERNIPYLHYGVWSARGLGEFKKHHAFVRFDTPRYFAPLNLKGKLILKLKLHQRFRDQLPDNWLDAIAALRNRWNAFRYRQHSR